MPESEVFTQDDAAEAIAVINSHLEEYGIHGASEIVYNPSYEQLFEEETRSDLEGFERGQVTESGAVNVMTGIFTGRSPKDKWIVKVMKKFDVLGVILVTLLTAK